MPARKIKNDPRELAACAIDKDRCMKVRIALGKGKVLVDLRAYVEIGSRSVRTGAGISFPIDYLSKVMEAMQRANAQIKTWEIGDD